MENFNLTIAGFIKKIFKAKEDHSIEDSKIRGEIMDSLMSATPYLNTEFNNQEDETELIAVIMAALSASLNEPASSLVVNKIRRVTGHSIAWNQAGLNDSIASRKF